MRIIIHFYFARSIEIYDYYLIQHLSRLIYIVFFVCVCDAKLLPPHFDDVKNENNNTATPPHIYIYTMHTLALILILTRHCVSGKRWRETRTYVKSLLIRYRYRACVNFFLVFIRENKK